MGQGGLATGGTITALETANDLTVGISAGNVFMMDVTLNVDSVKMAAAGPNKPPSSPKPKPPAHSTRDPNSEGHKSLSNQWG